MDYKLAQELKDAGYPQHLDKLMSADEVRPTTAYVRFGHRTFDLSMLGYPKTNKDYYEQGKWRPSCIFSRVYLESDEAETLFFPSLDELINEVDKQPNFIISITRYADEWWAGEYNQIDGYWVTRHIGKTPEEAVARLWIALQKN